MIKENPPGEGGEVARHPVLHFCGGDFNVHWHLWSAAYLRVYGAKYNLKGQR